MMRVRAVCAARFRGAVAGATVVEPLLCPPVTSESFDPGCLAGYEVVYFDLHGEPGGEVWYGQETAGGDLIPAVRADQLEQAPLAGAVVFGANCYLGNEESPMLAALLRAGARYVVAGEGRNWGPEGSTRYGAAALGKWMIRFMRLGIKTPKAVGMAKQMVGLGVRGGVVGQARADTLAFQVFESKGEV